MRVHLSNRDYEQISAYLDGQLTQNEQRRFEERLHAHPELQTALDELSRTRALLRQVPRRRAPRNFTLTPAMVGDAGPRRRRGFSLNLFPALSFTSALAALVLVATLLFQLLPGLSPRMTSGALPPAAPAAENQPIGTAQPGAAAAQPAALATATPAMLQGLAPQAAAGKSAGQAANPPIINWGIPAYGMGPAYGIGGGGGGAATLSGGAGQVPYLGNLLGPPAANSASAGSSPAYGMGGGGGPGNSAVYGPSLIIPPQAAAGLTPLPQVQSAAPDLSKTPLTGDGPILGVPPKDQGGQIIAENSIQGFPTPQASPASPSSDQSQPSAASVPAQAPQPAPAVTILGLPHLLFLQIILGAIAILAGMAAFLLRRSA